ncbi:Aquaporin Z [hydrothermal vent metagenome]|uniref:Aquaporin Z n=1 Tax=hydrothermal vent metagenome TaxID=652676 RepID=A0A3B0UQY5_9ZZZZ
MNIKNLVVEFIGTFLFLVVIAAAVNQAGDFAPIAIGVMLMVMVYAGGHLSGGHFNPAVTLGAVIRGAAPASDLLPYWVAQVVGGVLGAFVGNYIAGAGGGLNTGAAMDFGPGILAELIGTFALVYVVLNVATAKNNEGNSFYGLAIGFTVMAFAFAVGGVSGGAFNPAVGTGITLAGIAPIGNLAFYWIANLIGGALAALAFNYVNQDK